VTTGRGLVLLDGAWDGAVAVGYLTAAEAQAAGSPVARHVDSGDAGVHAGD
jgi:hypothetical protein